MSWRSNRPATGDSSALPARVALLPERAHALLEVLRREAGAPQLDELALDVGVERVARVEQRGDHALVARQRLRRVAADLAGQVQPDPVELVAVDDLVDEAP